MACSTEGLGTSCRVSGFGARDYGLLPRARRCPAVSRCVAICLCRSRRLCRILQHVTDFKRHDNDNSSNNRNNHHRHHRYIRSSSSSNYDTYDNYDSDDRTGNKDMTIKLSS